MRIIRLGELPSRPWKNGGGVTVEYIVSPEGADLETFDWRVSRAEVATDGPFSLFAGIDRTLTITDGTGIDLVFADGAVRLLPGSAPFAFSGDVSVEGRLVAGPIHDLNVMSRRSRFAHRVERMALPAEIAPPMPGAVRFVVVLGSVAARSDGRTETLAAGDMIFVGEERVALEASTSGEALMIEMLQIQ
ncbi:MAG: HutD family protein [Ancalomicrobiaceae bacterium]|nr:HutD family protein [Ancalomicrobiaceae bacterium]